MSKNHIPYYFLVLYVALFITDILITNSIMLSFVLAFFPFLPKIFDGCISLLFINVILLRVINISNPLHLSIKRLFFLSLLLIFSINMIFILFFIGFDFSIKDIIIYCTPIAVVCLLICIIPIKENSYAKDVDIVKILFLSFGLIFACSLIYFLLGRISSNRILLHADDSRSEIIGIIRFMIIYTLVVFGITIPTSFQYAVSVFAIKQKSFFPIVSLLWILLFNIFVFCFSSR